MHDSLDKKTVLQLLEELRRKDSKRSVFGSAVHNYELNPPIPVSTIEEFEATCQRVASGISKPVR